METKKYRAEIRNAPLGETGDYDEWIELVTPDFNLQCYDPDIELEQVQELADMLNVSLNFDMIEKYLLKNISGNGLQINRFMEWLKANYGVSEHETQQEEKR